MKVDHQIRSQYKTFDPEADFFFDFFDEPAGSKILEIGSQHSPIASMLAKSGHMVTGVDLRDSDQEALYNHMAADFCKMPTSWMRDNYASFDSVVCVSAIEHFGLNTYQEGVRHQYYDVIAMRYMYDLLKPGGICYITTPFGGKYVELKPHWRVYDYSSVIERLVQDFNIDLFTIRVVEAINIAGRQYQPGDAVPLEVAILNLDGYPNISCLLKLRK